MNPPLRLVGGWGDRAGRERSQDAPNVKPDSFAEDRAVLLAAIRAVLHLCKVNNPPEQRGLSHPLVEDATNRGVAARAGVSVSDALDLWRETQEGDHLDPKYIRDSHRNVRELFRHAGLDALGTIRHAQVVAYRLHLCKRYPSGSTVNNHLSTIRQFFKWAVSNELIRENPAIGIENAARNDGDGNREFTPEEAARMIDAARADEASEKPDHGAIRSPAYILAWNTGLRYIELGRLWKEDVRGLNTADCYLELHWTKAKNRRAVQIPLNTEAQAELLRWLPLIEHPRDLIFPTKRARGLPQLPHERVVDRDIEAAGIAKKDEWGAPVGFHSFRKGGATALAASGAPEVQVAQFLRHSDPKLTRKVYIRLRRKQLGEVSGSVPPVCGESTEPTPKNIYPNVDAGESVGDSKGVTQRIPQMSTASRPRPFGSGCVTNNRPSGSGRDAVRTPSDSPKPADLPTSAIAGAGFEPAPALAGGGNSSITVNLTISPETAGAFARAIVGLLGGGQSHGQQQQSA